MYDKMLLLIGPAEMPRITTVFFGLDSQSHILVDLHNEAKRATVCVDNKKDNAS